MAQGHFYSQNRYEKESTIKREDFEEECRAILAQQLRKIAATKAAIKLIDTVRIGCVYVLKEVFDGENFVEWVVIRQHPDDTDLWFMLPMNSYPGFSALDVEVHDGPHVCEGVIRCNWGVWVPTHVLRIEAIVGLVERQYVDKARMVLSCMVTGEKLPLVNELSHLYTDTSDPEYEEAMEAVAISAHKLSELAQKV